MPTESNNESRTTETALPLAECLLFFRVSGDFDDMPVSRILAQTRRDGDWSISDAEVTDPLLVEMHGDRSLICENSGGGHAIVIGTRGAGLLWRPQNYGGWKAAAQSAVEFAALLAEAYPARGLRQLLLRYSDRFVLVDNAPVEAFLNWPRDPVMREPLQSWAAANGRFVVPSDATLESRVTGAYGLNAETHTEALLALDVRWQPDQPERVGRLSDAAGLSALLTAMHQLSKLLLWRALAPTFRDTPSALFGDDERQAFARMEA